MISNPQEMRAAIHELSVSTWTLAAIGALLESGLVDPLREARTTDELARTCKSLAKTRIERILAVAASAGVVVADGEKYTLAEGAMPFAQPPMRNALLGDIRSMLMQPCDLLDSSRGDAPRAGWKHTDRDVLQAQGDASTALPMMLKMNVLPTLGDLGARLEQKGARFLDVGVGVGALAIAACRVWPAISVVGLDTFHTPLAIAHENVTQAGLGDRIELRNASVEDLRDEGAFDLAWLPSFFIPQAAMTNALARIRASLKDGGWAVVAMFGGGADDRQRAVGALLTDLWGGPSMTTADMQALLTNAGFTAVRLTPGPNWAPALFAAQR
jgi:SAM-dependent methyltransferase